MIKDFPGPSSFLRVSPIILCMSGSFITLGLTLIGGCAVLCAAAVCLMAWSLVHPPRMSDAKAVWLLRRLSPADLGLPFEDLKFQIRDERGRRLSMAAWWVPHPNSDGKCAVLVHGYGDAKVGAIAWAPVWHLLGFNLLIPDLRAHGESGGTVCTAGYFERHDLSQLIDELKAERPEEMRRIVLFGVSMGAAVAGATAALRTDIGAVVMDSPYADFRAAAMAHMDRLGLPGPLFQRLAMRLGEWLTYADYGAVRPPALIAQLGRPVLVILSGDDSFLGPDDRAALERAIRPPAELWTVENVEHLMALSADPQRYEVRLARFLVRAFPAAAPVAGTSLAHTV